MKIAIVHDHFLYLGGAERVLLNLLKIFPQADVYTSFITTINRKMVTTHTSGQIYTWFLNNQLTQKFADWFKPFIFLYWETLNLSQYDIVISSSHSFSSKSVITHPRTLHIAYIHTPPRYLYTEFNETQLIKKFPFNVLLSPFIAWLRLVDYIGAQRPDVIVANSKTVRARIQKYYRRNSMVIYPPVRVPKFVEKSTEKEYFLVVSRLVKQKGINLAIQTCNELKLPLVIVGEGKERKNLESISGPTIVFKGFVPDEQMIKIYEKAKAFIYCSKNEDFGIIPIEAMAHGISVIAYKQGGVNETMVDGKTGVFFTEYSVTGLKKAINTYEALKKDSNDRMNNAKKFSEEIFDKKIKEIVNKNLTYDSHKN